MQKIGLRWLVTNIWVVAFSATLAYVSVFVLVLWPRELPTDEKLALVEDVARSRELTRQGIQRHRQGRVGRALELYDQAIELRADSTRTLYLRGTARLDTNDLEGALEDFTEATRQRPHLSPSLNSHGYTLYELGDVDGAIRDFELSLERHPEFEIPYGNLGHLARERGDVEGAMQYFARGLKANPRSTWMWDSRGALKYAQGDVRGAVADFGKGIEVLGYKRYSNVFRNRAAIRKSLGDHAGAAQDMAQYQRIEQTIKQGARSN